ncbi:membrane protease YdiL (CAAX protease family) [Aequitasia blattaphilus]|uniref:CPBP family intramembrane metalloprotease n=1 Tax=Aequitasia blattaphilus TaxID=2949332 RepID=A0ABT1EBL9_9FIRM|nr:type II CAAX endopeptidase family protein [Aequitasia blattaphilus]MCP1102332.1 CPBP family intramembrane metalloprotease [Aequitasia blattaphilus]MCR8614972.1 CPBP family intramembrane metalloprotease [Aequitasia blattaphilus]
MAKRKQIASLIIGFLGAIIGLLCVWAFNQYLLITLPLALRMITMIIVYWLIVLVPTILMINNKDTLTDYGFNKNKVELQIILGVSIGIAMSLILTLLPHLLGLGKNVDNGKRYTQLWQFCYEFVYCIIAVGFVEEFVFRGFVFEKIKRITNKNTMAVIVSSLLFGVFHFLSGNIVQMILTGFIGAFFCLCKLKIKNCSMLSLVIAHGIYDALITVWASVLL